MMNKSVVLDTGFLISLSKPSDRLHASAVQHYKWFRQNDFEMIVPTVVIAEYAVKQSPSDLPLADLAVAPFNYDTAVKTAELHKAVQLESAGHVGERAAVKTDYKIIAHASLDAGFLLTKDSNTMAKYCDRLVRAGQVVFRVVVLPEKFDASFFNDGQMNLFDDGHGQR